MTRGVTIPSHGAAETLALRLADLESSADAVQADAASFENLQSPALAGLVGQLRRSSAQLTSARRSVLAALAPMRDAVQAILDGRPDSRLPHYFLAPLVMFTRVGSDAEASLASEDVNLPALTKKAVDDWKRTSRLTEQTLEEFETARAAVPDALTDESQAGAIASRMSSATSGLARVAVEQSKGALDILDAYRRFQTHFTERAGSSEVEPFDKLLAELAPDRWLPGPAGPAGAMRAGKAQLRLDAAGARDPAALRARLDALLSRYGLPFQGIVVVDNQGGVPLVLDGGADPFWRAFTGRLVLVVTGDSVLKDVGRADRRRHLITVIAGGALTAGGTIEASMVAFRSFGRPNNAPAARITGNLILARPVLDEVEPERILDGVTLVRDPVIEASSDPDGTSRPGAVAVLFAPVPVYARSLRRGPR